MLECVLSSLTQAEQVQVKLMLNQTNNVYSQITFTKQFTFNHKVEQCDYKSRLMMYKRLNSAVAHIQNCMLLFKL